MRTTGMSPSIELHADRQVLHVSEQIVLCLDEYCWHSGQCIGKADSGLTIVVDAAVEDGGIGCAFGEERSVLQV